MFARIFKPSKTAMQAGTANTANWVLEFEAETARRIDPLMGWTSADETAPGQVRLSFPSREEAVAFAEKHGLAYSIDEEHQKAFNLKAYSDNFAYRRRKPWTH
jgi:hypothetical protein